MYCRTANFTYRFYLWYLRKFHVRQYYQEKYLLTCQKLMKNLCTQFAFGPNLWHFPVAKISRSAVFNQIEPKSFFFSPHLSLLDQVYQTQVCDGLQYLTLIRIWKKTRVFEYAGSARTPIAYAYHMKAMHNLDQFGSALFQGISNQFVLSGVKLMLAGKEVRCCRRSLATWVLGFR